MDYSNLNPKNIIIRMPNWLGDLVMATPVIEDIRAKWPEAQITAMCQSNVAPILQKDPRLTTIFSFKRPSGWLHRSAVRDVIRTLKHNQYDLGILLTNSFSSAWYFWRGQVQNRIGYQGHYRSWLLSQAVPYPKEIETQHLVKTYKMLLEPLGIPLSESDPKLFITDEERKSAQELLKQQGLSFGDILVGINPGAAFGTAKCWLPERFQEVTKKLLTYPNVKIVYFGDPAGAPLVNMICQDFPEQVINLAGKTNLRQLMALIQLCQIFLTNDSGPMHIAAALGTPLLALFGSTSDVKTGPYKIGKVIHKHVECSPCYKRVCPIDFKCMRAISAEEVFNDLKNLIEKN